MASVLVSPIDSNLSDVGYGKSYNILNNLRSSVFDIEAFVGRERTPVDCENVEVVSFESNSKLAYLIDSYRAVYERLHSGEVDIYHHMNLSYRWFNPLLVAGLTGDVPTLIGPAQGGHEVLEEEFKYFLDTALGIDSPRLISDSMYTVIQSTRTVLIDPPRVPLYRRTLRRADRIVAVHREAKAQLATFVDESKIDVIPLGVDPTEFTFSERNQTTNLVAIGVLKERKGYDLLIEALAQVRGEFTDVHLHVFGTGPMYADLTRMVDRLELQGNVTFHGHVDQETLRDYLADARAFVHPSRSESFSLVRLEAMATGTPVVVSNTAGAKEMVRDGRDGFVVPREDPRALADALMRILGDFELARRLGRSARRRVEERYDWRDIGRQYIETYRTLL